MDQLDLAIVRCKVALIRDEETPGDGNCFPRAIIQQCERNEVKEWMREHEPLKIASSHHDLRVKVSRFALEESNDNMRNLREHYENVQIPLRNDGRSWTDYWRWMSQDKIWADDIFIQATAWYLGLDIKIITFTSTPRNPFMTVSGGKDSSESNKPNLYVGYYPVEPYLHYQSLLPKHPNPFKNQQTLKLRKNVQRENVSILKLANGENTKNWKNG